MSEITESEVLLIGDSLSLDVSEEWELVKSCLPPVDSEDSGGLFASYAAGLEMAGNRCIAELEAERDALRGGEEARNVALTRAVDEALEILATTSKGADAMRDASRVLRAARKNEEGGG